VPFDLLKYHSFYSHAHALLLDTLVDSYGGSGSTFPWSQLPINVNAHLVLSGGLTPANVADGIRAVYSRGRSLAVDVSSGVESAKGIKDADKIRAFVAAVRNTPLVS
jgi:phosphoribosylanthranilate isomerase